ncbi:4-coumarate-CoA ligase [Thamnocephalis sphaerospora]|uniref:4-coumarate-CoA ligase n=1 Tax=Thamnocephalis sphaerospora TaxID=78915 RepID=A0A4P9XL00_9FUNG|nr:4-coumarate-CoA ligase [Thamnocephalis sphaerospora]|eukprot:RKP06507.1 4-coumarate-CoA ligase [Thamnocephalis sphaerospora]
MVHVSLLPEADVPALSIFDYLFERPESRVNEDALVFTDAHSERSMTAAQLRDICLRLAAALQQQLGAKRGEVVAVFSPNDIDYPTAIFGSLAAGLTVTMSNPAYHVHEFVYQLRNSNTRYIIVDKESLPVATRAAKEVGIPDAHIIVMGARDRRGVEPAQVNGHRTLQSLIQAASGPATPVSLTPKETVEETAFICYSSGTTGVPKGVELTHCNIVSNIVQIQYAEADTYAKHGTPDVQIGMLPFYHIYALTVVLHVSVVRRSTVITLRRYQIATVLDLIQKHRVTLICLVPPIALAFAKDPLVDQYDLSSLRDLISAAAPLGAEVTAAVQHRLGVRIRQAYGMSESSPITLFESIDCPVLGSTGRLVSNLTAKIINEEGKEAPIGERGELWVRGPNIMKGYLGNPKATADTIDADGYLHTGDVAVVDEHGNFFIVDRIKELIKYKGFQVPPAELEAILQEHDAVADAAVIGIMSKEQATELPKAFVSLKPTHRGRVTEQELIDYVKERVVAYKRLRGGLEFIDVVPRSPSGKILRRLLRDKGAAAAAPEPNTAVKGVVAAASL